MSYLTYLGHYLSETRKYHNLRHIAYCLDQLSIAAPHFQLNYPEELINAIIWHDVIYVPGSPENEERSANLTEMNCPHCEASVLRRIIMATRHTGGPLETVEEQLIADIDLSSMAGSFGDFLTNSAEIRQEFSHIAEEDFIRGRIAFMEGLLARPQLFYTDFYRIRCEHIARNNIRSYIFQLCQSK